MNTEYLKEFVVLAETKNFGEASDRLYMNQSTLSKHIKSLENELGINLFLRTTRRVELTNYGQTFLPYFASGLGNGMVDMSASVENLLLEADALGLGAVWLGIAPLKERIEAVRTVLNVPENLDVFAIIPCGYPEAVHAQQDRFDKKRIYYVCNDKGMNS